MKPSKWNHPQMCSLFHTCLNHQQEEDEYHRHLMKKSSWRDLTVSGLSVEPQLNVSHITSTCLLCLLVTMHLLLDVIWTFENVQCLKQCYWWSRSNVNYYIYCQIIFALWPVEQNINWDRNNLTKDIHFQKIQFWGVVSAGWTFCRAPRCKRVTLVQMGVMICSKTF